MSSFSLPSHGGVVSLLNDAKPTKIIVDKSASRPAFLERHSSSSSSAFSTTSNGLDSSFDIGPIDALSSAPTSLNSGGGCSSISSLENYKLAEIHSLRKKLEGRRDDEADEEGSNKREADEHQYYNDDDRMPTKKRRSKEIAGRPAHSRSNSKQGEKILDHVRLASSPKPMQGASSSSEDVKDVPVNMHKATSMSEEEASSSKAACSPKPVSSHAKGGPIEAKETSPASNGKRRYPCSYPDCDKTFSTSGHAARHNRIHTGSKPYRCTFPGCNASFSRQDNSLQHYRTHVLHPKNRLSGANASTDSTTSANISANRPTSADVHQAINAETQATVRMGRKALEEGTAIAVVHEVVDGNGQRGEAVQRMVGQPKYNRRASGTTQHPEWKDTMHHVRAKGEREEDEDGMSVGTNWSYGVHHPALQSSHSYQNHPQPPSAYGHNEHPGYSTSHSLPYPPTTSHLNRSNGGAGPYSSAPHYRMQNYQPGSANYFSTYDYMPSKYPPSTSHFDVGRRGSANSATYSPQQYPVDTAASNPATAAARRFYSATTNPLEQSRRSTAAAAAAAEHRRARSFGGAQLNRPTYLEDDRSMKTYSMSPPSSNGPTMMSSSAVVGGGDTLPSIDSPASLSSGLRSRLGPEPLTLPPPSVSKLPYSSDRSTSTASSMPMPSDDTSMQHHQQQNLPYSIERATPTTPYQDCNGRSLPPLRSVLRK